MRWYSRIRWLAVCVMAGTGCGRTAATASNPSAVTAIYASMTSLGNALDAGVAAAQRLTFGQIGNLIGAAGVSKGAADLRFASAATPPNAEGFARGLASLTNASSTSGAVTDRTDQTAVEDALIGYALVASYAKAMLTPANAGLSLVNHDEEQDKPEVIKCNLDKALGDWLTDNADKPLSQRGTLTHLSHPSRYGKNGYSVEINHVNSNGQDVPVPGGGMIIGMDYGTLNPLPDCTVDQIADQIAAGMSIQPGTQQMLTRLAGMSLDAQAKAATEEAAQ